MPLTITPAPEAPGSKSVTTPVINNSASSIIPVGADVSFWTRPAAAKSC